MHQHAFDIDRPTKSSANGSYELTAHAAERMSKRSLSPWMIEAALTYGRVVHTRAARIFAIGRKEATRYRCDGVDLSRLDGVQVVCSLDGHIITAYRNRDFRELRGRRRIHVSRAA